MKSLVLWSQLVSQPLRGPFQLFNWTLLLSLLLLSLLLLLLMLLLLLFTLFTVKKNSSYYSRK